MFACYHLFYLMCAEILMYGSRTFIRLILGSVKRFEEALDFIFIMPTICSMEVFSDPYMYIFCGVCQIEVNGESQYDSIVPVLEKQTENSDNQEISSGRI